MHEVAGFAEQMSQTCRVLTMCWLLGRYGSKRQTRPCPHEACLQSDEQTMGVDRPLQAVLIAVEEINEWWDPE